jgi:hypothetical protein
LLLVKQQKWLSESVKKFIGSLTKIRVGRVTVNTHIFFLASAEINHKTLKLFTISGFADNKEKEKN